MGLHAFRTHTLLGKREECNHPTQGDGAKTLFVIYSQSALIFWITKLVSCVPKQKFLESLDYKTFFFFQ